MKKILHITECLGSGVLSYIRNLSSWQVNKYQIVIAYSTRPETPANFQDLFDTRIKFIRVNGFTREIEPVNDWKAFRHIRKIVRDEKPDLVHLHSTKAGVIGRWAIDSRKYIIFYSPHAYSFLMENCPNWKRSIYKTIERLSDRKRVLTIADSDGEYIAGNDVARNRKCIQNGIDTKELDLIINQCKRDTEKAKKEVVICNLGKVVSQKNPKMFNEIAKKLPDYKFLWIGAGPLEQELDSSNIKVTGWIKKEDAIKTIVDSDIFLFTSSWESLSIALMEAMYAAKPCVASKCDGNKDVIVSGKNGYLCNTVDDYVKTIEMLIKDNDLQKRIGAHARQDILLKHNNSLLEEKYTELFNEIGFIN